MGRFGVSRRGSVGVVWVIERTGSRSVGVSPCWIGYNVAQIEQALLYFLPPMCFSYVRLTDCTRAVGHVI